MRKWEYRTLIYGTATKRGRRWVLTASDISAESQQVGKAESDRFVGRVWQAMRLLETALEELDAQGWELVSCSVTGIFALYGTAVVRRAATGGP